MTLWKSVSERESLKKRFSMIKVVLTGLIALAILCLLGSCKSSAYLVRPEPINCINDIETPEDMLYCLAEYDQKYGSMIKEE